MSLLRSYIEWKWILNIKKRFEQLTNREIILLYLIVSMIYISVYLFSRNSREIFQSKNSPNYLIKSVKENSLVKRKMLSDIELIAYFNKYSTQNLLVGEIQIIKNHVHIQISGNYQDIIQFLRKIEENFMLLRFELKYEEVFSCTLRLDKIFLIDTKRKVLQEENFSNPFIVQNKNKPIELAILNIEAIIGREVLIDATWYKKGDTVNQYRVLDVSKNMVILVDTKSKKKIIRYIENE